MLFTSQHQVECCLLPGPLEPLAQGVGRRPSLCRRRTDGPLEPRAWRRRLPTPELRPALADSSMSVRAMSGVTLCYFGSERFFLSLVAIGSNAGADRRTV